MSYERVALNVGGQQRRYGRSPRTSRLNQVQSSTFSNYQADFFRYTAFGYADLHDFDRWSASLWIVRKTGGRQTLYQGNLIERAASNDLQNMMTPRYCLNLLNGNVFAKELVRKMLQKDPKSRISAAEAFKDSLFWTRQQKLEHIEHILSGPKSGSLENQVRTLKLVSQIS